MFGGRPVREEEEDGEEVRCAQSSGEWPGVRRTFCRGLEGGRVCVGGGLREEEEEDGGPRLGRRENRDGGSMRFELVVEVVEAEEGVLKLGRAFRRGGARVPPEARWAELAAGKEGM